MSRLQPLVQPLDPVEPRAQPDAPTPRPDPAGHRSVRRFTESLVEPLEPEDCVAQSMPDASPVKWHLAHTTWFFETFVLIPFAPGYTPFHPAFARLFNSYYHGAGERHPRPLRGLLTRPTLAEVFAYRASVDESVQALLDAPPPDHADEIRRVVEIGLHHEQQHQELILTDVKHLFAQNALRPAYRPPLAASQADVAPLRWVGIGEGVHAIGRAEADGGFAFDNEHPRHRVFLEPARLADRLVTNGEYRAFVEDGGYRRPELWLDAGWSVVEREGWRAPLYWRGGSGDWSELTLAGERALCDAEPVCHVSLFEADAFARWADARLPTEAEWEVACGDREVRGNFVESARLHPAPAPAPAPALAAASPLAFAATSDGRLRQLFGDVWEWTSSAYGPYPGYRVESGTLGEYNGKFMCEQFVLRGGSCASARTHLRAAYRNFFHAGDRWQLTGIRLAREAS